MAWNIKRELSSLEIADRRWHPPLVEGAWNAIDIEVVREWWRGGAETYCYEFKVRQADAVWHLIAKAMVAFNPAVPPDDQLASWLMRRERLASAGVAAPSLFAHGKGMLIEEFVPFTLDEMVDLMPDLDDQFLEAIETIIHEGFAPRDFVRNMRTDGNSVFWIDFGEDLGGLTKLAAPAKRALTGRAVAELAAIRHQNR